MTKKQRALFYLLVFGVLGVMALGVKQAYTASPWYLLVPLLILVVITAVTMFLKRKKKEGHGDHGGHDDHHHDDWSESTYKLVNTITTFVLIGVFVFTLFFLKGCAIAIVHEVKKPAQTSYSAPVAPKYIPCQHGRWYKKSFGVPSSGLALPLCQGWVSTPFGGAVKIHLKDGRILTDIPGKKLELGYVPDGMVIFYPEPLDSKRSVDIDNLWEN